MPAVVARHADLRLRAQQCPCFPNVAVLLAEVHAVCAEPLRQLHAVVDDEGHARVRADALQRFRQPGELMLRDILNAELKSRDDLVVHGALQALGETIAHALRGNQVEPARLRPLRRRKTCRIEFVVHC
jgi:hypothetical protein